MASRTLYPPIVKDYEPAFVAGTTSRLKVYFNLSAFSGVLEDGFKVHASIIRKDGVQVVNLENDEVNNIYRATGTILNLTPVKINDNYYYVEIDNDNLKSTVDLDGTLFTGWIPGWTYKIQLRLSPITCPADKKDNQEAWLQENSGYFSEWSTICYVKAISGMVVQNYSGYADNSPQAPETNNKIFSGSIQSIIQDTEDYYSCNITLYKYDQVHSTTELIEQSGDIFNDEVSNSAINYTFKSELEESAKYKVYVDYITENDYKPLMGTSFYFIYHEDSANNTKVKITTADDNVDGILTDITNIELEENEGRIGLKIYYDTQAEGINYSKFVIRRSSSKDNFLTWEDIKYINLSEASVQAINNYPIIYDYAIESGVWYKYGIAGILTVGDQVTRSALNIIENPIIRIFEYSYLLGQNDQQLKLQFDNTMSNYTQRVIDGQQETIGSIYPFVSRNSNVNYKTFPITGLITFWMDEENTFLKDGMNSIYDVDIVALYEDFNRRRNIMQYNYTYERDFRKKIIEFLNNTNPKLFKSPSEGNVIVRLKDVSLTPNQSVGRLIYSFSCTAVEIDDDSMYNYLKYGFYYPGTYT